MSVQEDPELVLKGYVIGVDVGGTFTDCVVIAPDGNITGAKAPTTPQDRSIGFFASIERAADKLGLSVRGLLEASERLVHGTTTGTNAIVSREGAKTGLITTSGHRDILFLMSGTGRTSGLSADEALQVASTSKPEPFVPKHLVAEVVERVDVDGDILVPLNEVTAKEAIRHLVEEENVEAIAVSLLWSVKNDIHERRLRQLIAEIAPDVFVTCASELIGRVGEYERTTTVVMNAYIGPLMSRYIQSIEDGAAQQGYRGRVLFAQCAGGAITGAEAKVAPIRTVSSGPVAGIVSSQLLAQRMGLSDVLLADMGGTTFDVSVIHDGEALSRNTSVLERYELALPMLDIESIGAGGGSIAWIDHSRRLNVGPKSAGAFPGPACYGQGGIDATVTDADVLMGFIDPARFLHGRMKIDASLARAAVQRIADSLHLDVYDTAAGICRIVDSKMADLIRRMSVLRGLDPRRFALLAFGGGGPVHAAAVAREAGIQRVIVPLPDVAAMWSALGAAVADVTYVYQDPQSFRMPVSPESLNEAFARLEERILVTAEQEELALPFEITRTVRMKYAMQVYDVEVPVKPGQFSEQDVIDVDARFAEIYESIFGEGAGYREGGTEITSSQVRYHGKTAKPELSRQTGGDDGDHTTRSVYWAEAGQFVETPVVRLESNVVLGELKGPLLVELPDTVVVIRPGMTAEFDEYGNLIVDTGVG